MSWLPNRVQLLRFGEFVALQGISKVLALVQGLVVIHLLSKWDYGLYALLFAVVLATANIAICGVGMYISAVGGRHVHDAARMAAVYAAGRRVQGLLIAIGLIAVMVILPLQYVAMGLSGATLIACLTGMGVLLMLLHGRSTLGREVLAISLHLRTNQLIELAGAVARLAMIGLLFACDRLDLVTLTALGLVVAALSVAVQERLIDRWVVRGQQVTAPPADVAEARRVILPQLPNAAYSSVQDQVPYLLMAWIGSVQNVAEYAAMGRLGIIFSFFFDVMSQYFMPRVGRCQDPARLGRLIAGILSGYFTLVIVSLIAAYLLRGELVWLLGRQYANLEAEVPWMLALIGVGAVSGSLFVINSSRAWLGHSWVFILSTVLSQATVIPFLPLDTLRGMLQFAIVPHLPFIVINVLFLLKGLRRAHHDLKAPLVP